MTDEIKTELNRYRTDAASKLAELPARVKTEAELATLDNRRPRPIIPLTEVHPQTLAQALAEIKEVPDDLEETVGTLRRVCREHPAVPFSMKSEQLIRVLDAAGLKPNTDA